MPRAENNSRAAVRTACCVASDPAARFDESYWRLTGRFIFDIVNYSQYEAILNPVWRAPMTFQAYLDNIKAKTGKSAADFELGHGHAMAIVALLKGTKSPGDQ